MKVAVIGYYGENFGDLLMLSVLIERAKLTVNTFQIYTYGSSNDLMSFLKRLNVGAMTIDVIGLKEVGVLKFLSKIRGAQFIAWGGGTCFMDEGGTGGIKYMLLARMLGVSVFYLGVGIDAHKKYCTRIYIFIAMCISRRAYFRDEESLGVANIYSFRRKNTAFIPDLAFSMRRDLDGRSRPLFNGEPYIAVCPRELELYFGEGSSLINLRLSDLVNTVADAIKTKCVAIIVADAIEDSLSCSEIAKILFEKGLVVESFNGSRVDETIRLIDGASFLVSVRLHPAVVSQLYNTPYVLFGYSEKNIKYLNYVNSPKRLISLDGAESNSNWFENPDECFSIESARNEVLSVLDSVFSRDGV